MPVSSLLARAHPALVHAPLGAVLFLPLALGLALRSRDRQGEWLRTGLFLATLGILGGLAAVATGFMFGRELGGIAPGAWLARAARPEPSFPALLRHHQFLAGAGFPPGAVCWLWLWRARRGAAGTARAALAVALVWLALWGAAGHWGGRMVFKDTPADGAEP
jgi:hypothetical protein